MMRYSRNSGLYVPPSGDVQMEELSRQADGLRCWWPLRHATNVALDHALYQAPYNISRCPSATADPDTTGGECGAASLFNTNTGYSDHADQPAKIRPTTSDHWAITCWAKFGDMTGETSGPTIIGWYLAADSWVLFRVYEPDNQPYVQVKATGQSGQEVWAPGPVLFDDDLWHHVALVWEGSPDRLPKLYIDGLLQNTGTTRAAGASFWVTSADFHIGWHSAHGARQYIGGLCDLRYYQRTSRITAQDIWDMYDPETRWDLYWQPKYWTSFPISRPPYVLQAKRPAPLPVHDL